MWSLLSAFVKPVADWVQREGEDEPRKERLRELLTNLPEGVEW